MYSKIMTSNYENILNKNDFLEECIEYIGYGSKDALSNLYEVCKNSIYSFSLSILKNKHDAEDVLQEVFIKIYENASTYQKNGKPMAWILTITKNLSLMKLRKKKNHTDLDLFKDILPDNKKINDIETKLLLSAAFECISDDERNILVLHAVSGFKHREISKILGLPLATVLSKYSRSIKKIKNKMSEERKHEKKRN